MLAALLLRSLQRILSVVLTTRRASNAEPLAAAILAQGHDSSVVELDLVSEASIQQACHNIRSNLADPDVLVLNAGYLEGRDLPPEMELLEFVPTEIFDTAQHIASRGYSYLLRRFCLQCVSVGVVLFHNK